MSQQKRIVNNSNKKESIAPQNLDQVVDNLPKSARIVFRALMEKGPMKSRDLSDHTSLSSRTVRYGLEVLRTRDLVKRIPDFNDLRSHFYSAKLVTASS